jgi:Beta-propeller repeat
LNAYSGGIALDSSGNSYVTGSFEGTTTIGSATLTSKGKEDVFVVKIDSSCNMVWAVSAGGALSEYVWGISVDSSGNSYVTGSFRGTATFGTKSLTSKGDADVFVAKVDAAGTFKWAVSAGGVKHDEGRGIAVDSLGNSYVTGRFGGTATFGTKPLTSKGDTDVFVVKVDVAGTFKWAVSAGGTLLDYGQGIAVDTSGNSYVTGYFRGTATFGTKSHTSKGKSEVFVAKVDAAGAFKWAISAGGVNHDEGRGIAVDSLGNSYVTGRFGGTATFGTKSLTAKGYTDVFVTKVDAAGTFKWAVSAGGPASLPDDQGKSITVDSLGNSYVTGSFGYTATFGTKVLKSKGYYDVFVAKVDAAGTFKWAVSAGGNYYDHGAGIAVDSSGNTSVTGTFMTTVTFGTKSLTCSTPAFPGYDCFVAKVDANGKFLP